MNQSVGTVSLFLSAYPSTDSHARVFLDALADLWVVQHVDAVEAHALPVQDAHHLHAEAALRGRRRALHVEHHGVRLDVALDHLEDLVLLRGLGGVVLWLEVRVRIVVALGREQTLLLRGHGGRDALHGAGSEGALAAAHSRASHSAHNRRHHHLVLGVSVSKSVRLAPAEQIRALPLARKSTVVKRDAIGRFVGYINFINNQSL